MPYSRRHSRKPLRFQASLTPILFLLLMAMVPSGFSQSFGIYRELWTGLSTTDGTLNALTNQSLNPKWPSTPTSAYSRVKGAIETEVNYLDGYGQRLRGFVVPPATGDYQFWIASDDSSLLLLSSDEDPAHVTGIARVDGATGFRQWDLDPSQTSGPIPLEAGRRYYLEVLHKEAGGGDNLSVRWQLPSGIVEEPITNTVSGTRLIPFRGVAGAPGIYSQTTNVTVFEGRPVVLSVLSTNQSAVTYQWQLNGVDLQNDQATRSVYNLPAVRVGENNGQIYRCVLTTPAGVTNSKDILLTVLADTVAPTVLQAQSATLSNIWVQFSEPLQPSSVQDLSHFSLSSGDPIRSVEILDPQTILLHTVPLQEGSSYTLSIQGVMDLATIPNVIAVGTTVSFVAHDLTSLEVGGSVPPGSSVKVPGGWDITGGGGNLTGKTDQFHFEYQRRVGDFDLAVRVDRWTGVDLWSRAGLMARETLDPGSRFGAAFSSGGIAGCFYEYRNALGALPASTGSIPANDPQTWLRLKRSGAQVFGFASYDGERWAPLGQSSLTATALYVGLAVESHSTNATAIAQFRDLVDLAGTNPSTAAFHLPWEPLGPSSRKTGLVISEIQYQPAARPDGANLEFIEIYNTNPFFEDLSGYSLAGTIAYTFPTNTLLQGGSFLVVAAVPGAVQTDAGVTGVLGPYQGSLRNIGPKAPGLIQLLDAIGSVLLEIPLEASAPWPVGADGEGHSVVLSHPSYGESDPRAWSRSDQIGGSPGRPEVFHSRRGRGVVINEFLAHTDAPLLNFIELFNTTPSAVDLSGAQLTDISSTNRFTLPAGTIIPARGFLSFDQNSLGFAIPAAGGTLELWAPDRLAILDAVAYEAQASGISSGRSPDGTESFYPLQSPTPGATNNPIRMSDVVINEIMYKPISGNPDDQYVELFNQGTAPADLSDWSFTAGINYTIPTGTVLMPGKFLVIAHNRTNLFAHYPQLSSANTVGDFGGKLPHPGRLALSRPDLVIKTLPNGQSTTNKIHVVVDEVTYETAGRWGQWANGGGSSLELVNPRSDHRLAANWADSDESAKSSWVTIESYGQLDNGANQESSIAHLQLGILDVGECLVDDIEVRPGTQGPNYVKNPGFELGMTGWDAQGCHLRSSIEGGGIQGSQAMHLRCSDRIWTGANSLQGTLTNITLSEGKLATLRLKARWLRGWPEVLMRLNGNWMETTGSLPVPSNLGTPGLPNSQSVTNVGPAIYQVSHQPSLPAAGQSVVVTARLHDADGLGAVTLNYRVDPALQATGVAMNDSGIGGDAVAGDGIWSATIPGQAANTLVAFWIDAADKLGATTRFPALSHDNRPTPEAVVMFGDSNPGGTFAAYHLWVTKDKSTRWAAQPNLSNESWDCTFVYGDRVIYDVQARFSGSPYHQSFTTPDGALCHYKWTFPDDDKFLGATSFNKIHQPGNGPNDDDTLQREQTGYWLLRHMGLPWNYRRYVAVFVNGNRRGLLMEDTQTPDSDVVKEHWPNDSNGYLFKLQPWFEFDPTGVNFNNNSWNTLNNYTTLGGEKKLARYRWNYLMRKTPTLASDYSKVYELVNAANLPTNNPVAFAESLESVMDVNQWIRTFAVEHSVGNWDSVGNNNGQNMYGYVGQSTRWNLLVWDLNILLASSSTPDGPTGDDLFKLDGNNAPLAKIVSLPQYKRAYWRAYKELAEKWYQASSYSPLMDAKYAAFVAEGVAASSPAAIKSYMSARQSYLTSQLATVKASFAASTNQVVITNGNLATLTGTAPIEVAGLLINGQALPVIWVNTTTWRVRVAAMPGTNEFQIQGLDAAGGQLTNAIASVRVISPAAGPIPDPVGVVVLNEILYHPALPNGEFVEIYNSSPTYSYDLSGWRLDGLNYVFPPGSILTNGQYLVVGKDRYAVTSLYGNSAMPFDLFTGDLSHGDGRIALIRPGAAPEDDTVVSRVRYEAREPWPVAAQDSGVSLQLVDASQDASRVGNWSTADAGWQFFSVTTNFLSTRLQLWLDSIADLYLDDVSLVQGSRPGEGANLVRGGDFEGLFTTNSGGAWVIVGTPGGSSEVSTQVAHGGKASLHLSFGATGTSVANIFQDLPSAATNGTVTLSFWYLPNLTAGNLVVRVGNGYKTNIVARAPLATPGRRNSMATTIDPIPSIWLNEIAPNTPSSVTDISGARPAWFEVYNSGPAPLDLSGYSLASGSLGAQSWTFPTNSWVEPGEFKLVFLDGHPESSTELEWHAGIVTTGSTSTGGLILSRALASGNQVVDYLNYDQISSDRSYGSYPDGQAFDRGQLSKPTPSAPNNSPDQPGHLWINEWMSSNTSVAVNAATGKHDDWFEVYNSGPGLATLSGLSLGFGGTNPTLYLVPDGYLLAPGAHLLVWADKGAGVGNVPGKELHTNFRLSKSGGTLGIYRPDGTVVDRVTYAAQAANESDGRCPDGGSTLVVLASPSPGGANQCTGGNTPPVVSPVADTLVYPGESLTVKIQATDADLPVQHLSFQLLSGAPAGAVLDAGTGVIQWTPDLSALPGKRNFEVRVTDDGTPQLSTTISFGVTVMPPLRWGGLSLEANGELRLRFGSIPGKNYQVQFKDELDGTPWQTFDGVYSATGVSMDLLLTPGLQGHRFYRLVQSE